MAGSAFQIDLGRKFPNLPRAPIVEAVLQWLATPTVQLTESPLRELLVADFPEYEITPQLNFEAAFAGSSSGVEFKQSSTWQGFRLTKSEAGTAAFVCQFKQDGLVFSRLAPYCGWETFVAEGMRFWNKFVHVCKPDAVARLSVRYISQIAVQSMDDVTEYIDVCAEPFKDIGVSSTTFFHQDTVKAGELPYIIHVITAVQPSQKPQNKSLIVDIDVATEEGFTDFDALPQKLRELQFIKNEVFFALMKDAENKFGGITK